MKKRNGKKNEVMAGRAKCESLQFQAEWGAKKLGVEMSDVVRQRITEEIMVLVDALVMAADQNQVVHFA